MSLTKQKDNLIRERDRLTTEVDDLNKKLLQQRLQTDAIEKRRLELEEKCRELYKSLDVSICARADEGERERDTSSVQSIE